jgi:hypothetical protein
MKLLRFLITFIAGTVLGAVGQSLFGLYGMLLGSVAGSLIGWWGAKRIME